MRRSRHPALFRHRTGSHRNLTAFARGEKPLGVLFDEALGAYGRRIRFYLLLAVAAFAVQGAVASATRANMAALVVSNFVVDAFLIAVVTLGVASDLRAQPFSPGKLFSRAGARLWAIVALDIIVNLAQATALPLTASGDSLTAALIFVVPGFLFWAAVQFATAAAVLHEGAMTVPAAFATLRRSFELALSANFRGAMLLALVQAPPLLVAVVLTDLLTGRHANAVTFWANVPLDALLAGPYQALITVAYLDRLERPSLV